MAAERRAPRPLSFPLDDIRPSDAEREEVVEQLRYHAEQGRLDTVSYTHLTLPTTERV